MTIATALTFFRLGVALISFVLLMKEQWTFGFIVLFIAVVLDSIDGVLARKLNDVTTQGIYYDIMVDKIVIIGTFLIVGHKLHPVFFYLGLLMLTREYMMDTFRSIAASKKVVISADRFSKIKGVLFMISMLWMIGTAAFVNNDPSFQLFGVVIACLGMLLAIWSLSRFYLKHKGLLTG
ncbi:MAG: CDP-alcohol phosphatidyltransferase family protein [Nanoarchaeota archaeon]